ncbi:hypothetical protein [Corynebacterium glyciniphilum]|uniref:hypothetical protein n=1 Tax=Corynebacterium glyciniphilum TaxID=1404244 RepID=UPI0011AB5D4A|nr:hypothetical protein [Corynebacterium glyciniphilum]
MPHYSELAELIEHGNGLDGPPVRATLRLHGDPGSLDLTVQAEEPTEVLRLPAGDYRFLWADGRRSLTRLDGTPLLLQDGQRTLVLVEDGAVVDATGGRVDVHCVESALITRGRYVPDRRADVRPVQRDERESWSITGNGSERIVDAETGVVVSLSATWQGSDKRAEFIDVEFPGRIGDEEFRWAGEPAESIHVDRVARPVDETRARAIVAGELDRIAVPEPPAAPEDHRILPVAVEWWVYMDLNRPTYDVGSTVDMFLWFIEQGDPNERAGMKGDPVVTVDAYAEETTVDRPVDLTNGRWSMILRGDGWSALWDAPRPVLGRVRLTGHFYQSSDRSSETPLTPTRGRVTRLRYRSGYTAVDVPHTRHSLPKVWVQGGSQIGVDPILVTLDLDAASPPEPAQLERPTALQGFAVTGGVEAPVLWRGDLRLPIVWRTDVTSGESTAVALPVRIQAAPMYIARVRGRAGDGCRVDAVGHTFLVGNDGSVVEEERPAVLEDFPGAVRHPHGGWVVSRYEVEESWMHMPENAMYGLPVDRGVQRLGRLADDGTVDWKRELPVGPFDSPAALLVVRDMLMTSQGTTVSYLDDDLQEIRTAHIESADGYQIYDVTTADDCLLVNSSDGSGKSELRRLDPETLEVLLLVDGPGRPRHLQVDGTTTAWSAVGTSLRLHTRGADGEWTSREIELQHSGGE